MLSAQDNDFDFCSQDTFEASLHAPAGTQHIAAVPVASDPNPASSALPPQSAAAAAGKQTDRPGKLTIVWFASTMLALAGMILVKWFN
jgi:hypothetical protein